MRTGGNTTNLHKHLQKNQPSKIKTETETTGEMNRFVLKETPVRLIF